jgi:hypothetical protein
MNHAQSEHGEFDVTEMEQQEKNYNKRKGPGKEEDHAEDRFEDREEDEQEEEEEEI